MIKKQAIKLLIASFIFIISIIILHGLFEVFRFDASKKERLLALNLEHKTINASTKKSTLLKQLIQLKKEAQIGYIFVQEDTIQHLIENGQLSIISGADLKNSFRIGRAFRSAIYRLKKSSIKENASYLFIDELTIYERTRDFLIAKFGDDVISEKGWNTLEVFLNPETIKQTGVGFSKKTALFFESINITIIPVISIPHPSSRQFIKQKLDNIKDTLNSNIISTTPSNKPINSNIQKFIKNYFNKHNWYFSFREFDHSSQQLLLSNLLAKHSLKTHDLSQIKANFLKANDWSNRYLRASKERRVTILVLDPRPLKTQFNLSENEIYNIVNVLKKDLLSQNIKIVSSFEKRNTYWQALHLSEIIIIHSFIVILILLFLKHFYSVSPLISITIMPFLALMTLLQTNTNTTYFISQWLCLGLISLAPAYALTSFFPKEESHLIYYKIKDYLSFIFKSFFMLIGIGLIVYILHANTYYIVGIKQFFGVKISFIIPIFLVGFYFYLKNTQKTASLYLIYRLLKTPITLGTSIAVLCIGLIFTIYLLRSGNYVSLPSGELLFRNLLEDTLFIRPRMKEIWIGYPFLMFSFFLLNSESSLKWRWFFKSLACVAFISLLNSFCHFHTPPIVSLYRSFLGLFIGNIVGLIIIIMYQILYKLPQYLKFNKDSV